MKKLGAVLAVILCIGMLAGCGAPASPAAPTAPETPAAPAAPAAPATPAAPETPAATEAPKEPEEPKEPEMPELDMEKLYAMLPIMEAAIEASDGSVYTANDPQCFWSTMYLMCVNNGAGRENITIEGATMFVRDLLVAEFATALFADYTDIPPVPEDIGFEIGYDMGQEAYVMGMSDGGPSSSGIVNAAPGENGNIFVMVRLEYEGGESVADYEVELTDNAYIGGITGPEFYYSVVSFAAI